MRKVYTDPALKDNKRWTVYTTNDLYKDYKVTSTVSGRGIMDLVNEALTLYMEILPVVEAMKTEAEERGLEITDYVKSTLENRNST